MKNISRNYFLGKVLGAGFFMLIAGGLTPLYAQDDVTTDSTEVEEPQGPTRRIVKKDVPSYPMKEVSGRVLDAATHKPISGVRVQALDDNRFSGMTEEDGRYKFSVPEFTTVLFVSTPDYNSVQVPIKKGSQTVNLYSSVFSSFYKNGNTVFTNKEAANYIKSYLAHYSGIDSYMKNVVEQAKETGYAVTMFGRRRYLPELSVSNHMTRAFGERVARNMPIQGTAADIIKIAMINVDKRINAEGLNARLILQVHDELIVEAPFDESMRVAMLLQEEMEKAVKLSVPLVAEASVGETWYDAKS